MSVMDIGMRNSAGLRLFAVALGVAVAGTALVPSGAAAQCMGTGCVQPVGPDGKGMVGLGLIGAELGLVIPALVQEATGTNEWWPYLVFPLIGAAGGVVGGYFMEQETRTSPEIDVAFMAIGMALVVPAVVATLALTAYDPGEGANQVDRGDEELPPLEDEEGGTSDAVRDDGGSSAPAAEPASSESTEGAALRQRMRAVLTGGTGLLRFDGPRMLLAMPVIHRMPTFTAAELEAMPMLTAQSDVFVPVVSGTF